MKTPISYSLLAMLHQLRLRLRSSCYRYKLSYTYINHFKNRLLVVSYCLFWVMQMVQKVNAQTFFCPPNINFESGNLAGWYFYTGFCCPIEASTYTGAMFNRHSLQKELKTDPYGGFPVVDPEGGSYSLKIGNNGSGSQAEKARYYIRVPQNLTVYSLIMRYAVVLQDPGHTAASQPRFEVKGYDSATLEPLPCVQFSFIASSSIPGFKKSTINSTVIYKDWTTVNINLSGREGRTIILDFSSGDCAAGGHFGYGYVDINCDVMKLESEACSKLAETKLIGPVGFREYEWYDSTFLHFLGSGREIIVPTPLNNTLFRVVVRPYPGFGCDDTLTGKVIVSDMTVAVSQDTAACKGVPVQLNGQATTASIYSPVSYHWTPHEGLNCYDCPNPIASPPRTTEYTLTVKDQSGCVIKDSLHFVVKLFSDTAPQGSKVCFGSEAQFKVLAGGIGPFYYQWYQNDKLLSGETRSVLTLQNVQFMDTLSRYSVVLRNDQCDSIVSIPVRVGVYPQPILNFPDSVRLCQGSFIEAKGFMKYLWSNGSVSNRMYIQSSGLYSLAAIDSNACSVTDSSLVTLEYLPNVYAGGDTTICNEAILQLKGIASNYDSIWWSNSSIGTFTSPHTLTTGFYVPKSEIGLKEISLFGKNYCGTREDKLRAIFKQKIEGSFNVADTLVCAGSYPIELIATEGQGYFSGLNVSTHFFDPKDDGMFAIYYVVSADGCVDTSEHSIRVVAMPEASFILNPLEPFIGKEVQFVSTSKHTVHYLWSISQQNVGTENTLFHTFQSEGEFVVLLTTFNEMCWDTSSETIWVNGSKNLWLPNVFTPDGDGVNDEFKVVYRNSKGGVLSIFNQWGQLLYISNDLNKGWDGTFEGQPCKPDVYVYTVDYFKSANNKAQLSGNVTLLR
jgi:gliding motility-associated-like protein